MNNVIFNFKIEIWNNDFQNWDFVNHYIDYGHALIDYKHIIKNDKKNIYRLIELIDINIVE